MPPQPAQSQSAQPQPAQPSARDALGKAVEGLFKEILMEAATSTGRSRPLEIASKAPGNPANVKSAMLANHEENKSDAAKSAQRAKQAQQDINEIAQRS
jgi:hypothetical protein